MSDNMAAVKKFLTCLERLDASPIEALLTDDAVEVLPLAASGRPEPAIVFEGKASVMGAQKVIVNAFSSVAFNEVRYTKSDDGRTIFVESVGVRRHKDSGEIYRNIYVLKFEFRDSLISRITEYSNPVAFAKFFHQAIG